MWKEFLGISLHDPIIWFALIAATIILFAWRTEVKRTRLLEQFAIARGFKFERVLEAEALGLSETDFFYRRDDIRNAVSGNLNGAHDSLFSTNWRKEGKTASIEPLSRLRLILQLVSDQQC